jgi:hypothetical protein
VSGVQIFVRLEMVTVRSIHCAIHTVKIRAAPHTQFRNVTGWGCTLLE